MTKGQPKKWKNNAEKQAAYRERKRVRALDSASNQTMHSATIINLDSNEIIGLSKTEEPKQLSGTIEQEPDKEDSKRQRYILTEHDYQCKTMVSELTYEKFYLWVYEKNKGGNRGLLTKWLCPTCKELNHILEDFCHRCLTPMNEELRKYQEQYIQEDYENAEGKADLWHQWRTYHFKEELQWKNKHQ
jgi:hypothetical protein